MTRHVFLLLCSCGLAAGIPGSLAAAVEPAAKPEAAWAKPSPERMEWFQDMKFGLFMHWGIDCELGCIESWPLVWADRKWSNPQLKTLDEMLAFRQQYWALNKKFNPTKFCPEDWAAAAKRAGMKYVMFTTTSRRPT